MLRRTFAVPAMTLALCGLATADAMAAGQRSFVASNGNDGNPCTLQLPCRSFAPAIAQTNAGGEVIVLDSAGYGSLTITKSISIIAPPGVYAGLSPTAGQDGVSVSAGASDKVVMRGLTINGQGGDNGIVVNSGGQVHIEQCTVSNMSADGIRINGGGQIFIGSSIVRSNASDGLEMAGGTPRVEVIDSQFARNAAFGIRVRVGTLNAEGIAVNANGSGVYLDHPAAGTTAVVTLANSVVSGNGSDGATLSAETMGGTARMTVVRSTVARNDGHGLGMSAFSATGVLTVSDSAIVDNTAHGLFINGGNASVVVTRSTLTGNGFFEALQGFSALLQSTRNNTTIGPSDGTITPLAQF